ncbi:MAG TPA: zinc-binding dehydrogenase [Acidimicrobiales bacterium]|nr:zinc-binding dehydrogenase [Acidimicrobiales bacterium]
MKALLFERSLPKFAAARVASGWRSGSGARVGPLRLADVEEPELPDSTWHRVRPQLSGICGSDLATIDGRSSRYFEPLVSFPFIPGHEVVGRLDDDARVVLEPVLRCAARGIDPPCPSCAEGRTNLCRNVAFGHLKPGLQTGFCEPTGGGWGGALVAHESQLHRVPDAMSDRAAVMVEPAACALHGALLGAGRSCVGHETAVIIGAGTLGLCTAAAVSRRRPDIETLVVVAKHQEQRRLARELADCTVVEPAELARAVRRRTGSLMLDSGQLTGGASLVFDCVGSSQSLQSALSVVEPGGTIVMLGMPGEVKVDLTGLWQREVTVTGAYAYGVERLGPDETAGARRTFDLSFELVADAGLERLVSALYPLDRYREAIEHAADAGHRGATKVAFDLRRRGPRRSSKEIPA